MKSPRIILVYFLIIITSSCKNSIPDEDVTDNGPFKVTTLLPLSDDIPYKSLGSGKILFERKYTQNISAFYVIDVDNKKSLGFKLNSQVTQPSISPTSNKIACSLLNSTNSTSNWNIHVMNLDGTDCYRVSPIEESASFPLWSEDGSKIVYYTTGPLGAVYEQAPAKNATVRKELIKLEYASNSDSIIKPSGGFILTRHQKLIGVSNSEKLNDIVEINLSEDMKGIRILASQKKDKELARLVYKVESTVLSPDGLKVAFALSYTNPLIQGWTAFQIFSMDIDGNNPVCICGGSSYLPIDYNARNVSLCWSPDQTRILYSVSDSKNTSHLYIVNLDFSGFFQVTNEPNVYDSSVSWSQ